MEWDHDTRSEQADALRWLADEYESGRLTHDIERRYANGKVTTLEVVRAITDLDGYIETIRDEAL